MRILGPTLAIVLLAAGAAADTPPPRPVFDAEGTVHVPAFELPPSALSSKEAQEFMKLRARRPSALPTEDPDIARSRARLDDMLAPQIASMRKRYPVDVVEGSIAGVPVRIVTPQGKPADPRHVLINLHGGGFSTCWGACSMLESVPIAALGGYRVISVNYRQGPEAKHPAALEDATAVYRSLLKTYPARRIGLYGCSAGGALTAEMGAWLPLHGLPEPGAAGIFGAGGLRFMAGDSAYVAGYIDGSFPPPSPPSSGTGKTSDMSHGYFDGADLMGPVISPALHPEIMAKFPPTLIITGTRAMDLSPATVTNSALIKAGVPSEMIVGEGMSHCFIYQHDLPEARDAHAAIVAFFRRNLAG
jgi:acetyl esterase/lipase